MPTSYCKKIFYTTRPINLYSQFSRAKKRINLRGRYSIMNIVNLVTETDFRLAHFPHNIKSLYFSPHTHIERLLIVHKLNNLINTHRIYRSQHIKDYLQ